MAVRKNLYLLRVGRRQYALGKSADVKPYEFGLGGEEQLYYFNGGDIVDFCAKEFHRCVNGIRLKPGEVKKVKITIEEVK